MELTTHATRSFDEQGYATPPPLRKYRYFMAVLAVFAAVTTIAVPAYAATYSWNSKSNPLTARNGDGDALAQGYGTWKIGTTSSGTRSQGYGYLRDAKEKNGYRVYFELHTYVNSGLCIAPQYTSCSSKYFFWAKQFSDFNKETWGRGSWSPQFYSSTSVDPGGDFARAGFEVAESNKGPDSQSGMTLTRGNKY